MRSIFLVGAAMAAVLGIAGCGGGGSGSVDSVALPPPPQKIGITLDGLPSPQTAGILMAQRRGYFEDEHLEVWIHEPVSPTRPVPYVVTREVDLAISHEPQVVLSQERGAPIVAIGSLVSRPTITMTWLKRSKIGGISGLRGKTIAIAGLPFERSLLKAVLARSGLTLADVKVKAVGYELVQALVTGHADATFGGSWNVEGIQLRARGLKPVVKRVQGLGVPTYDELVLIARRDRLAQDPRIFREFIRAMDRGMAAVEADPKAAASVVAAGGGDATKAVTETELEKTMPIVSTSGRISAIQADRLIAWMTEEGLIPRPLPVSKLFTNEYLRPSS